MTIDRASLERLEVSVGTKRHVLQGLGIGAVLGVGVGAVLGLARGFNDRCPDNNHCVFEFSAAENAVSLGIPLGTLSAIGGAIAGLSHTDVWAEATR